MDNFDDRPLERPAPAEDPAPEPNRVAMMPIVVIAAVGLALGGLGAWWWLRSDRAGAPASPEAAGGSDTVISQPAEPARELPPLGQMDTFLRALLGTLSSHPDFARWLATDDLIRQMAHGVDRISRGLSPAADLPTFRPQGDFTVTGRRGSQTIDPASYRRYDRLALMVESLDPRGVVEAYRTVQPRLDEAYRALGRSDRGVDDAVRLALQTLIDTPVPSEPVRVVPGRGATFAYADPQLERLQPVQKQLVRMGPQNMRRIQSRLREIQSLLQN